MGSNNEYEMQCEWNQVERKPCFNHNDGSQMAIDAAAYFLEREREMYFGNKELNNKNETI